MITTFLHSLYLWFYCLPLSDILNLVIFLSFLFLLPMERYGKRRWWKIAVGLVLLLWLAAALWITLGSRGGEVWQEPVWIPLHSYYVVLTGGQRELVRANFMNMVLFYPAGLLAGAVLPKCWKGWQKVLLITSVCCALSFCIEFAQYRGYLGLAETDDVIHNTLGALLGCLFLQKMSDDRI